MGPASCSPHGKHEPPTRSGEARSAAPLDSPKRADLVDVQWWHRHGQLFLHPRIRVCLWFTDEAIKSWPTGQIEAFRDRREGHTLFIDPQARRLNADRVHGESCLSRPGEDHQHLSPLRGVNGAESYDACARGFPANPATPPEFARPMATVLTQGRGMLGSGEVKTDGEPF